MPTESNDAEAQADDEQSGTSGDSYVHRPAGESAQTSNSNGDLGAYGWVLIGAIAAVFLVVPTLIMLLPILQDPIRSIGLQPSYTILLLGLLSPLLLAVFAVWIAVRSRAT